ncbi:MAG: hypothetical protein ACRC5M_06230 [Anaeroplasmataceae bacterium]
MAIVGNEYIKMIYNIKADINHKICETLDYIYTEDYKLFDEVDLDLLNEDEHFYVTCCSALIIWNLKRVNQTDRIPKWCFDDRLILKKLYVFGRQYRHRDMNFVALLLKSPSEFTYKKVIFDPDSLVRY